MRKCHATIHALLLCTLILAGCGAQSSLTEVVSTILPEVSTEPSKTDAKKGAHGQDGAVQQQAAVTGAAPQKALVPVNDDPNQFLQKTGVAVAAILGAPTQIRRDGPAEIWHYRRKQDGVLCMLDVFLYGRQEGDALETRYVDLRGDGASLAARRACLASMIRDASNGAVNETG